MDSEPSWTTQKKRLRKPVDYDKVYGTWKITGKVRSFPGKHCKYEAICVLCGSTSYRVKAFLLYQTFCQKCLITVCGYFRFIGQPKKFIDATPYLNDMIATHLKRLEDPEYDGPKFPLARGENDDITSVLLYVRQLLLSPDQ